MGRDALSSEPTRLNRLISLRLLVSLVLFGLLAAAKWARPFDDSLITLVFSHELVQSGWPQWSTGERVEGFSSPSWMLLLAGGVAMGLDGLLLAKALGVLFSGLLLVFFHRALPKTIVGSALLIAISVWAPFSSSAVLGMETALYALLLTVGWSSLLLTRPSAGLGALFLAALTRPEGSFHLLAASVCDARRGRWRGFFFGIIGLVAIHLSRWWLFGSLLSAPYLAKVASTTPRPAMLSQLGAETVLASGVLLALVALLRSPRGRWCVVPALIQLVVLTRANGDLGWARLLYPGVLASVACLIPQMSRSAGARWWLLFALLPMALDHQPMRLGGIKWRDFGAVVTGIRSLPDGLKTPLQVDIQWLVEHTPEDASVWMTDVGLPGHVPALRVQDGVGLVDRQSAEWAADGVPMNERLRRRVADEVRRPWAIRLVQYEGTPEKLPGDWARDYPAIYELKARSYTSTWYAREAYDAPVPLQRLRWEQLCGRLPSQRWLCERGDALGD